MKKKSEMKKLILIASVMFALPVFLRGVLLLIVGGGQVLAGMFSFWIRLLMPGVASVAMYEYLRKKKKGKSLLLLSIFSFSYGMSTFGLSFGQELSKTFIYALFPLLQLCFERITERSYRIGYGALLTVCLLISPSMAFGAFMVHLLIVAGNSVVRMPAREDVTTPEYSHWMVGFLFSSVVSFGLSAFVWLPDLGNRFMRINSPHWRNFQLFCDGWRMLSRFFVLSGDAAGLSSVQGSNLYCGVTAVILCVLYLFTSEKTLKNRVLTAAGLAGLLSLVTIRPLYDLFTVFSDQDGVVVYLAYLPVFFVLKEAASGDDKKIKCIPYKRLIPLLIVIVLLVLETGKYAINDLRNESVFITVILVTVVSMIVVFYRRGSIKDTSFRILIILCFMAEIMINTYDLSASVSSADQDKHTAPEALAQEEQYEEEELIWDPFETREGTVPEDLKVSSGLSEVSILQYDSGVVAFDAHKVAGQFPMIIVRYRFEAREDGVLFIKHGEELKRYGVVKKKDFIDYDCVHETRTDGVEYESVKVCYVDEKEEALALEEIRKEYSEHEREWSVKKRILFDIGVGISVLIFLVLFVLRKHLEQVEDRCILLWEGRKYRSIPMGVKAFLIPFGILILACIYAGVTPFGENTFWHGDGLALTMPTMFQARDQILRGSFLYSFSSGGGSNLFYFNPALFLFFWLVFVPEHMLAEVIGYVVLVKVALCASTMYLYLTRSELHKDSVICDHTILIFTTAYALSSYQLCLTSYFYWSDIVLFLPLILLAMEKMLIQRKPIGYCSLLAFVMILNCYNAIYICFFLVFWFFTIRFENVRDFLKKGIMFAMYSFLSAGMSFWVIYATLLSRRYGFYTENDKNMPIPSLFQSFWITLRQFFIVADPISGTDQNGMCNLYCGIFVCLLLLYGLFTKTKSRKYLYRIGIGLFIFLSTNTSTLDYIWNGFHYQNHMPGRYTFLLVFLLTDLSWNTYKGIREKGFERKGVIGCFTASVVIGIMAASKGEAKKASIICTLIFFALYMGIIFSQMGKSKEHRKLAFRYILAGLALTELFINTCFIFSNYASSRNLYAYRDAAKWLKEYDPNMTGVDRTAFLGSSNANFGESSDLGSLGIFNSFLTPQQILFASSLGMASTDNMIRENYNMTPLSNAIGRVKYIIVPRVLEATGVDLDGYKVIRDADRLIILENENLIPEGFFISDQTKERIDQATGREELLNILSEGYVGEKVFDSAIPLELFENLGELSEEENAFVPGEIIHENFMNTKLSLNIKEAGRYYWGGVCYAYLGEFNEAEHYEIERIIMQPEIASLLRFNQENFGSFLEAVNRNGVTNLNVSDGKFEGSITTKEAGYLCVPIPYEPGWKATVNHKEVVVEEMRNGMIAVKLSPGENRVELSFVPNGIMTGILISVLSFSAFCGLSIYGLYKEKKNGKGLEI